MNIKIRQEEERDYKSSENLVEKAFENLEYSDHREHILVKKLRESNIFISELAFVAEVDGDLVGHIMLTKLIIKDEENTYNTLALAPLSVLPEYQNKAIGSKLIRQSLKIAKEMGFGSVIVLGHDSYYQRFGFKAASTWDIKAPFEVEDGSFMALELEDGVLDGLRGTVVYSKEFLE